MSAPTPGPWVLDPEVRRVDSRDRAFAVVAGDTEVALLTFLGGDNEAQDCAWADGRLIEAAPNLLAKLEALCISLRIPVEGKDDFECYSAEHEAAEVLLRDLAKAGDK